MTTARSLLGLDGKQSGRHGFTHVLEYIPERKSNAAGKGTVVRDKRYFNVRLLISVREVCVSAWITECGEGLTSGGLAVCPPW